MIIGWDNKSSFNGGTTVSTATFSHTCSATQPNLILFVGVTIYTNGFSGTQVNGVTYKGVSMNLIDSVTDATYYKTYLYYLINPATGANNVVVTTDNNLTLIAESSSYFNVKQTGQPEVYGTAIASGTAYTTLTTTQDADWIIVFSSFFSKGYSTVNYGSYIIRQTDQQSTYLLSASISDSNASFSAGANVGGASWSTTYSNRIIAAAFKRIPISLTSSVSENIMNSAQPIGRFSYVGAGSVPSIAPIISFRYKTSPFGIISSILNYIKTSFIGTIFPVLNNEDSDPIYLRIYNNFTGGQHVADALNVQVTTWDGTSLSASMAVASQQWLHIQQNGFGEGSSGGALFTEFPGVDYAIGGADYWSADNASNGTPGVSQIRSASNWPGTGFLELKTYILPKAGATGQLNNFVLAVNYEYSL